MGYPPNSTQDKNGRRVRRLFGLGIEGGTAARLLRAFHTTYYCYIKSKTYIIVNSSASQGNISTALRKGRRERSSFEVVPVAWLFAFPLRLFGLLCKPNQFLCFTNTPNLTIAALPYHPLLVGLGPIVWGGIDLPRNSEQRRESSCSVLALCRRLATARLCYSSQLLSFPLLSFLASKKTKGRRDTLLLSSFGFLLATLSNSIRISSSFLLPIYKQI
jgi:hypothetical protein